VDGPRAAVQRIGDSAAVDGSAHGTKGDQLASEDAEAAAQGSRRDAQGEPLALGADSSGGGGGDERPGN